MGIRYEKDTILNWINEMGKFLRLLVDKQEGLQAITELEIEQEGYRQFFSADRAFFQEADLNQLENYVQGIELEQVRYLAQLLMQDGFIHEDKDLLRKAKHLFEYHMKLSGSFSFEDAGYLAQIDRKL